MSSGASLPFRPAGTASVAGSTSAASVALVGGGSSVLVYNAAGAVAFVRFGMTGVTAGVRDTPVPPGARMLVDAGQLVTTASAVLGSGTGSVFFTRGDGSVY
ncbi:MAG: hypothetical protein B7Z58_11620 [Acidiphilium sp. 37-64-53]|uniref:hypothetical protein n=1 Tax=Acidiphilium TaxID=522 RepID=UPI000BD6AEFC|nr:MULTISPECIES: hypothetical protein [Acidiphilium]OYV61206.1 MAG: hypothetical protein B7X01_02280 [Acidiphilium sp. 21-62-4]OYW01430.1 MAG: hypothetical protein B7Z58_11620 [Acidiphilium sp. 37-64-53]OZB25990.1 MAG: hypothetical protein B7X49_12915 [Acidiphilium sp. 34-64-41]HQT85944.1 hypothetical protein [Acidiphilium rubrum]